MNKEKSERKMFQFLLPPFAQSRDILAQSLTLIVQSLEPVKIKRIIQNITTNQVAQLMINQTKKI